MNFDEIMKKLRTIGLQEVNDRSYVSPEMQLSFWLEETRDAFLNKGGNESELNHMCRLFDTFVPDADTYFPVNKIKTFAGVCDMLKTLLAKAWKTISEWEDVFTTDESEMVVVEQQLQIDPELLVA